MVVGVGRSDITESAPMPVRGGDLIDGPVRHNGVDGSLTLRLEALLWRPQRVVAVRSIRGYRTAATTAAPLLAGTPRGTWRQRCSPNFTGACQRHGPATT